MSASRIVATSMGGSKFACAVVECSAVPRVLASTGRIEWRELSAWRTSPTLETLMGCIAAKIQQMLDQKAISSDSISMFGLGWPGPGVYSAGVLRASFVPGCETAQPVHKVFADALSHHLCYKVSPSRIRSCLDVVARAFGESAVPAGAYYSQPCTPGIELNIATGIAAAIIGPAGPMISHPEFGETYGQWGRYLFFSPSQSRWHWLPTKDGSIPVHDASLVRFTARCAGPALARRFVTAWRDGLIRDDSMSPESRELLERLPVDTRIRDLEGEKRVLGLITQQIRDDVSFAKEFGLKAAHEIGSALRCVLRGLDLELEVGKIVLAGGVGENFARPHPGCSDSFIHAVQRELAGNIEVCRSRVGLEAEFLGFAHSGLSL